MFLEWYNKDKEKGLAVNKSQCSRLKVGGKYIQLRTVKLAKVKTVLIFLLSFRLTKR